MRWIRRWTRSAFRARSTKNAKRRLNSAITSLNPRSTLLVRTRTTLAAAKSKRPFAVRRLSFVKPPGKRQPGWRHRRHPGHLSLRRSVRSHHPEHAAICRRTRRIRDQRMATMRSAHDDRNHGGFHGKSFEKRTLAYEPRLSTPHRRERIPAPAPSDAASPETDRGR